MTSPLHGMPLLLSAQQASGSAPAPRATRDDGMLMGFLGQRRQLASEIEALSERRAQLVSRVEQASGSERSALREQLVEADRSLASSKLALRAVDRAIANLGGEVGTVVADGGDGLPVLPDLPPVVYAGTVPPMGIVPTTATIVGATSLVLVLGVVIGMWLARRFRRDATDAIRSLRAEFNDRLEKLGVGVDTIAVEVERIGEGQRFYAKAVAEGQAQKVEVRR
jgi:hypothetical protein